MEIRQPVDISLENVQNVKKNAYPYNFQHIWKLNVMCKIEEKRCASQIKLN